LTPTPNKLLNYVLGIHSQKY